jgi:hypothetical protein
MPAYLSWTKYLVPSNQYCRQDLGMALSHQIFFDIMEARWKGFEIDNAFEFDYARSIGVAPIRIETAHTIWYRFAPDQFVSIIN